MTNIFQEPKALKINGIDITVAPLAVKNLSKAARCAAPLVAAFEGGINPILVLEHSDSVIELCAIATNQSAETIGEFNAAQLLELLTAVVEVNGNFFSQVIAPTLQTLVTTVQTIAEGSQAQMKDGKKS